MCEKCDALDRKIAGIRQIVARATDKLDLEAGDTLIGRYEAEKRTHHAERKP